MVTCFGRAYEYTPAGLFVDTFQPLWCRGTTRIEPCGAVSFCLFTLRFDFPGHFASVWLASPTGGLSFRLEIGFYVVEVRSRDRRLFFYI